ncbi:MAG TPA: ASKHA domain-containing protein, partial [Pseudomonadales bacterium]|nr:ASKHA domain-containing protein [Pseudomonadales bacterium]
MSTVENFEVLFLPSGLKGEFAAGTPLLDAARELGIGIESICGGTGACAKCKCQVLDGTFDDEGHELSMSHMVTAATRHGLRSRENHVSPVSEHEKKLTRKHQYKAGERLSCQARVVDDVVVFIPEEARVREAIVRKAAGKPVAVRDPVTRKYFAVVPAPTLEDHRGDWERLRDALKAEHQIDTDIDFIALKQLSDLAKPQRAKIMNLTATVWLPDPKGKGQVVRIENGDTTATLLGLAVDLGTTTMASYLCDMHTGETLATESLMNPQINIGGDDVMNRIAASDNPEKLDRMQKAVTGALGELADRVTQSVGYTASDISEIVLVANTCMHHIFLGLDPDSLGKSPFNPRISHSVNIKARDLQIAHVLPSINIHLLANQAGFVGADNTAVAIALEPYNSDDLVAIVDIGTNGEILVGNRDKIYSTSCPTGPALEGASIKYGVRAARGAIEKVRVEPKTFDVRFKVIGKEAWNTRLVPEDIRAIGLCGSGIIDAVGELYKAGILAANGKFNMEIDTPRLRRGEDGDAEFVIAWANETAIGRDITMTIDDVRNVQLAKAAVYSGIQVLL